MSKSNVVVSNTKSKKESFINGSLAIKSHASWMKVLTSGKYNDDEMGMSAKTSSTLHTANVG